MSDPALWQCRIAGKDEGGFGLESHFMVKGLRYQLGRAAQGVKGILSGHLRRINFLRRK